MIAPTQVPVHKEQEINSLKKCILVMMFLGLFKIDPRIKIWVNPKDVSKRSNVFIGERLS